MTRKERVNTSPEQKLEYAKMMVESGYKQTDHGDIRCRFDGRQAMEKAIP